MRSVPAAWLGVALLGVTAASSPREARAQGAVGFAPRVGVIPDGVQLGATPVVSADRRYVRLSLGVGFQTIDGFSNFPVPAAVSGGGANGGGLGGAGLGGLLGGGGAGAGGAGNAGAGGGGPGVVSGMNGPIEPGLASGPNMANGYGHGYGANSGQGFNGPTGYDPFLKDMATTRPAAPVRRAKSARTRPAPAAKKARAAKATASAPTKAAKPAGG